MTPGQPTVYEQLLPDQAARVDAACDAFERAWKAARTQDAAPRIATYLGSCDAPERTVLVRELIALDQACRERYGVPVQTLDYYDEFGVAAETLPSAPCIDHPGAGISSWPEHWPSLPGLEL